ncbi:ribbon-helix-helix protein, CopG family [Humitalea rosea]|nr:ribbon-helix-helix protein, CopG family [Humitalea rosea]
MKIDPEVLVLAGRLAAREGRSVAAIIEAAIRAYATTTNISPSIAELEARAVGPEDEDRGGPEAPGGPGPTVPGLEQRDLV